jgi:hypothetical protein
MSNIDPKERFKRVFDFHGLNERETQGDQVIYDCPFSGKPKKLYVNPSNGLWDSKVAGLEGNHISFIREFANWCKENTSDEELMDLCEAKSLPLEALKGNVFYNPLNNSYVIPEYNEKGQVSGLGKYTLGGKGVYRTPESKVTLNYLHDTFDKPLIFICEGEWDAFALKFLIKNVGKEDQYSVVIVPGSNTFKDEWQPFFKKKNVVCCYDNDKAGHQGEKKATKLLKPVAKGLKYVNWAENLPEGYDVRDYIIDTLEGLTLQDFKNCFASFLSLVSDSHNFLGEAPTSEPVENDERPLLDGEVPSYDEVKEVIRKHLKMTSFDVVDIILGTIYANQLQGDPVWMFLVAPPGGSKTEMLMTLNKSHRIVTTTTLTAPALVSGIRFAEGQDPSLLIKVNEKMLVIKDFTAILSMNAGARDEVFGYLRDIYDGYIEKYFGTGVKKAYHSKFGILAGVTPAIDVLSAQNASLGERFLKFRLDKYLSAEAEIERIYKAIGNVGTEDGFRDEIQTKVALFLKRELPSEEEMPRLNEDVIKKITAFAMFTAYIRGAVTKDSYTGEMLCMPVREVGTRLAKQLSKLAIGICCVRDWDEPNSHVIRLLKQVCLDTCPDRVVQIIKAVNDATIVAGDSVVKQADIVARSGIPSTTAKKIIEDLVVLKILEDIRSEVSMSVSYKFTPLIRKLIVENEILT